MAAMMEAWTDKSQILIAIPLLGAALGLAFWPMPRALKIWALLVTGAEFLALYAVSGTPSGHTVSAPLILLLILVAALAILGQYPQKVARADLFIILILMGLGLGFMVSRGGLSLMFLGSILGLLILLVSRNGKLSSHTLWWGIGMYGFGMICLLISLMTALPASNVALLLVFVVLLPLFPFHGGYVAALAGLPGTLPAFLAVLLPIMGFHGVLGLIPSMPAGILQALVILALLGALYASLKALVQFRVAYLLAYASLAFFSILWWYLATTQIYTPQAAVYFSSVALVTGGLFLAWQGVQSRYGDLDLDRIGGLARPMPRFATLLSLLVMAAMGLPPFGLFSGYIGMLLNPSIALSWDLLVILLTWLMASWYFLSLMQRILFGQQRPHILYEDLRHTEAASLVLVLLILVTIGITPYGFFESDTLTAGYETAREFNLWKK